MTPRIRSPELTLALLTALNLLNYLDRYVVAAVLVPMQMELGFSNAVAGLLPSIFLVGYFVTSPLFGALGDGERLGEGGAAGSVGPRNALLAAGVATWSAATIASGLAGGTLSLVASRAFVGVGEASYTTLAPTVIDEIAPRSRSSAWMSMFYAATPIGSALGYIVGGAVLHSHGWRSAFFLAGVPGLVLALGCLWLAPSSREAAGSREPSDSQRLRTSVIERGAAGAVRKLGRIPLYRGAVLGYCAHTFAIGGLAFWAPKYLHVRYGLDPGVASLRFGLLTVVGGALGTLAGGALADRIARRRIQSAETREPLTQKAADDVLARANLTVAALGCGLGAPLSLAAVLAPTAASFFALSLASQIALFLLSGPINVALLRAAPPTLRASAMAASIFAIHAFGDLWSPGIIGAIADRGPMQNALFLVPGGFSVAAFVWGAAARASARLT